ncbi:MAG: hypothetical protein H7Y41_00080 [Hyphomonadaceae bacterium]|nr:hypothetical protein [Clostridia bacterium]
MKRWFIIFATVMMMLLPISVFASPDTLGLDEKGTVDSLIVCNNGTGEGETTFETNFVLSGSGKQNVVATMYIFDNETQLYKKVYITKDGKLVEAEWVIGASGLFMQEVTLTEGNNKFAIRAAKEGDTQVVHLEIVRMNQDFFAIIKGIKVDLNAIYDSILNGQ